MVNINEILETVSLPPSWKWERNESGDMSLWTGEGQPFRLDYSRLKPLLKRQPLVRAIGLKAIGLKAMGASLAERAAAGIKELGDKRAEEAERATGAKSGRPLFVLDLMAGWGREAFLLAKTGCHVAAVESHPLVFVFAQAALDSYTRQKSEQQKSEQQKSEISNQIIKAPRQISLEFIHGDSLKYLKALKAEEAPDVIYMDPMFHNSKKSLSQKPLRILKTLAGEAKGVDLLFQEALKKARKRVVVKRHRLQPPIFQKPLSSFFGRSVCFDVYQGLFGKPL